jgi:hypothetical protein
VVVAHEYHACYSDSSSEVLLRPVGDTYASEELVVPRSLIEAARDAVYASRNASRDVLVELGLDAAYFEAAPAKIAAALLPHSAHSERTTSEEWAQLVGQSATREVISRRLERQVVGERSRSFSGVSSQETDSVLLRGFSSQKMEITLPCDPPITITHESISPFYLPWCVVAGRAEWTTSDVRLTRALAPLIWTEHSFDTIVAKWREWVLADASIWRGLEDHAESVLDRRIYSAMHGFAQADVEWEVADSTYGVLAGWEGQTLSLDLRARRARSVSAIRWYVPIVDNGPANDWNDLLKVADDAERAATARPWLARQKSPSLELQAVGARPHVPHHIDASVSHVWRKAGFLGSPEFEFLLRNNGAAQATVYLSGTDRSGLVIAWGPGHGLSSPSTHGEQFYFDADGKAHTLR